MTPILTFYEFFAGSGMARAGLGPSWRCVLANDNDAAKARSYARNWGADHLKVCDVANLTAADLPMIDLGAVDLAWSSFPCQDISLAGGRAGLSGERSGTFWPFWRLIEGLRSEGRAPKTVVIENVAGLLTSHSGADFDAICEALAREGYWFGALVIDAEPFVPQSRKRVFIVAFDRSMSIPSDIVLDRPSLPFHPPVLVAACSHQRAAPIWWRLPVPPLRNIALADLIEDEPIGVSWHPQAETDRLVAMMSTVNIAKLDEARRTGERMIGAFYKRMRPPPGGKDKAGERSQRLEVRFDGVAGCLRTASAGGSNIQYVMVVDGPSVRTRRLSAREAARLMGLPDAYRLPGNYIEAYDLAGDGVVVPVVRHLAEHILEPLLQTSDVGVDLAAE